MAKTSIKEAASKRDEKMPEEQPKKVLPTFSNEPKPTHNVEIVNQYKRFTEHGDMGDRAENHKGDPAWDSSVS